MIAASLSLRVRGHPPGHDMDGDPQMHPVPGVVKAGDGLPTDSARVGRAERQASTIATPIKFLPSLLMSPALRAESRPSRSRASTRWASGECSAVSLTWPR